MRKVAVAMETSRRKQRSATMNDTIAATKRKATGIDASKLRNAALNIVAMTPQMQSAVTVENVNDTRDATGQHAEHRTDRGEEKDRRD
jgi:hypothetical protein